MIDVPGEHIIQFEPEVSTSRVSQVIIDDHCDDDITMLRGLARVDTVPCVDQSEQCYIKVCLINVIISAKVCLNPGRLVGDVCRLIHDEGICDD